MKFIYSIILILLLLSIGSIKGDDTNSVDTALLAKTLFINVNVPVETLISFIENQEITHQLKMIKYLNELYIQLEKTRYDDYQYTYIDEFKSKRKNDYDHLISRNEIFQSKLVPILEHIVKIYNYIDRSDDDEQ